MLLLCQKTVAEHHINITRPLFNAGPAAQTVANIESTSVQRLLGTREAFVLSQHFFTFFCW